MPRIFISYRRDDSRDVTGHVYERLAGEFGAESVFMDVDSIAAGDAWPQRLQDELSRCHVLLAVIGRDWLIPRLHDEQDYVRREIETALARPIPVIPVLVRGASMPKPDQLPPESLLQDLPNQQAITIRAFPDFDGDMARLIEALRKRAERLGLTTTAPVDAVLARYCEDRVREWGTACTDPNDPDKLTHYIEPHYSLLKEGFSPADASSRLPRRDVEQEGPADDPYEPVASSGDAPEVELIKLIESGRLLCITEDAGAGKTIFTRRLVAFLCSPEARGALFEGKPPLVVRWEAWGTQWPDDYHAALQEAVEPALAGVGAHVSAQQIVDAALRQRRVVLILDALDQVSETSRLKGLARFLDTPQGRACRVVLTSRSYAVSAHGHTLFRARWRYGRIDRFTRQQQDRYLADLCDGDLSRLFCNYDEVAELLSVPVVLRMVRSLAENDQLQRFKCRGELYLQASWHMIRRAATKLVDEFDESIVLRLEEILSAVAFQMMVDQRHNYAVRGVDRVARLRTEAAKRCSVEITEEHWQMVKRATGLTNRCLLEASGMDMLSFKHRGMMEFYCGLFLARNRQPDWTIARQQGDGPAVPRCGDPVLRRRANDENWYWAWRFAIEMPEEACESETLCTSLAELFERPESGRRPTELMYRAWPVLDDLGQGQAILDRFRGEFEQLVAERNPEALQLAPEQRLVEMGILSEEEADRIPPDDRNFIRCPPARLGVDGQPFWMGSAEGEEDSSDRERPRHRVVVSPFQLQRTTVTRAQYRLFDPEHERFHSYVLERYASSDACPTIMVSWYDGWVFARWMGGRLPTEAEWEYACRAGSTTLWCFGDWEEQLDDYAWYNANSDGTTHPVGKKQANAWGLRDTHGNVWEWCADWYDDSYYGNSPASDPEGPSSGSYRVNRGGCWFIYAKICRSACRNAYSPGRTDNFLGFRVSRVLADEARE